MRAASAAIVAGLATLVAAGTAIADSSVPHDPGFPRRSAAEPAQVPAPAVRSFAPVVAQDRPTPPGSFNQYLLHEDYDAGASGDAAIDQMLGVLPGGGTAAEGAKHIYVTKDGDLGCVTLDTFWPEDC